jgi:hypothetical protein
MKMLYDVSNRTNPIRFGVITSLAIVLFVIGLLALICSIVELFHGRASAYQYDETRGGLKIESPLWPSSGKSMSFVEQDRHQ